MITTYRCARACSLQGIGLLLGGNTWADQRFSYCRQWDKRIYGSGGVTRGGTKNGGGGEQEAREKKKKKKLSLEITLLMSTSILYNVGCREKAFTSPPH